jgi:hypothetical protein
LDVALRVLVVEEEELGNDCIGDLVVNGGAEEDDAVAQQAGIDVVYALAAVAALDHIRDHALWNGGPRARRPELVGLIVHFVSPVSHIITHAICPHNCFSPIESGDIGGLIASRAGISVFYVK